MTEFTLDELMKIHQALLVRYCDPEISEAINEELMIKLVNMIEVETYQQTLLNALKSGKLTAYVKHEKSGAVVPLDPLFAEKMQKGEKYDLEEAEKKYDRYMFKLPDLAIRWGLDNKETLGLLIQFEIPCFVNPRELDMKDNSAMTESDDVCIFEEYVHALEKNEKVTNKNEIHSIFLKKGCIYE